MLVAIHQPNFFPWLGYFDKLRRADVFVVLDNVQQQKKGGSWTNRVKLNINNTARWVTAPIVRTYHGTRQIREIEFDEASPWREKLFRTLSSAYGRAPHFADGMQLARPLIANSERHACAYNLAAIRSLATALVDPARKIVLASDFGSSETATDLLIDLVHAVGGDAYLSGGGADDYLDAAKFQQAGVRLIYQNFKHPTYPQHASEAFLPGLSILDTIMNIGVAETRRLLWKGPG